ncbi:MAG: Flp pilus assembly protein CpaB [Candidatus Tyrphobacter sp.]
MLLVVAAVLAAGAGLLTFNYLSSSRHVASVPPRPVLVAVANIPARASLTGAMVNVVMRPNTDVDPGALSSPSEISGDMALGAIPAGATITSSNTAKDEAPAQPGLHIMRGYLAISIPVDEVRDVSGLVQPGDKVDVIAVPPRVGDAPPSASIILRDVTVFAVGGTLAPETPPTPAPPGTQPVPIVPRSVTLEVTPPQADLLAMADLNATLRLALRPKGDRGGATQELIFASEHVSAPAAAPSSSQAPPRTTNSPRIPYSPVEIIDGDQIGGSPDSYGSSTR